MRLLFMYLFLSIITGIFVVVESGADAGFCLTISVVSVLCAVFLHLKGKVKESLVLTLIGFSMLGGYAALQKIRDYKSVCSWVPPDCYLDIKGRLTEFPVIGPDKSSMLIDVNRVAYNRQEWTVSFRVRLIIKGAAGSFCKGDMISGSVILRELTAYSNFQPEILRKRWLSQGIHYRGITKSSMLLRKTGEGEVLFKIVGDMRNRLRGKLRSVKGDNRALLEALLLGNKGFIDGGIRERLIKAGIFHLVVVSGTHVGVMVFIVLGFFRAGGKLRSKRYIYAVLPVAFYVVFTGSGVAAIRAGIVFVIYVLARLFSLKSEGLNLIGLCGTVMLLTNPGYVYDPGFILTFAISSAIIAGSGFVSKDAGYIKNYLTVSVSAVLVALPLSLFYFGRFSFNGLVLCLIIVPLVFAAVFAGFFLLSPVSDLILQFLDISADIFFLITDSMPAYEIVTGFTVFQFIAGGISGFVLIFVTCRRAYLFSVSVFILYCSIFLYSYTQFVPDKCQVFFSDVGQGDCSLVVFPNGKALLIDGGGAPFSDYRVGQTQVLPFLKRMRVKVSWIAVSHYHPDHSKGVVELLNYIRPEELWLSSSAPDNRDYREIIRICNKEQIIIRRIYRGYKRITGGCEIHCLWPVEFIKDSSTSNNYSQVLKLVCSDYSVLFTGDIESAAELALVEMDRGELASDILKVPHHGSGTSSGAGFLDRVGCNTAVISCGYKNRFGFPAKDVVSRYVNRDICILCTAELGGVRISCEKGVVKAFWSEK